MPQLEHNDKLYFRKLKIDGERQQQSKVVHLQVNIRLKMECYKMWMHQRAERLSPNLDKVKQVQ